MDVTHLRRVASAVLGAASIMLSGASAPAQSYPHSTVKIVVPIPPGGVADGMARLLAQRLQMSWGKPVVVDNRPGGNSAVGAQAVARSPADGYTILVAHDGLFTSSPFLSSTKLPYSLDEFTPIFILCRLTPVMSVNAAVPARTVQELVALSKAKPGTLSYGSFGIGTYSHLGVEDFKQRTGADILHVPYRGAAPAMTDLLAGQISTVFSSLSSVEDHAKAGAIRIIAAATSKRIPSHPDLPTIAESGLQGFEASAWFGLFGPANMPAEVVAKLRMDVAAVLDLPETKEFFRVNGFQREDLSLLDFQRLIQDESRHRERLIKTLGVKLD